MKFFFPDSQDLVDPSFDFVTEARSEARVRQRDDLYAHEVFPEPVYDGLLVSMAVVDGTGASAGRYTLGQRQRFFRAGVREFLRIEDRPLETMGDCGAFAYVREKVPPVTVNQVMSFYEDCGFDYGASIDHIILPFNEQWDHALPGIDPVPEDVRARQDLTLTLAREFLDEHRRRGCRFTPMGVAQGWSPNSYRFAVGELQKIGYRFIALGGMVPLQTPEILKTLQIVDKVRRDDTCLHLFGVSRISGVDQFQNLGVTSFDSTSPLRQAFKEDRDNYYASDRTYTAIRVPQVGANPKLHKAIVAGEIDQAKAIRLEQGCLDALRRFDAGKCSAEEPLKVLQDYQQLYDPTHDYSGAYAEVLRDMPWKHCPCAVCRHLGIHVVIFRGAERNRRRGFHNVYVTYQKLQGVLSEANVSPEEAAAEGKPAARRSQTRQRGRQLTTESSSLGAGRRRRGKKT